MSKIIPFKAVRPVRDKAYLVSSMPAYTYKKHLLEAKLERRDTLSVIDLSERLKISNIRKRGVKQAQKLHLTVNEESNFD